MPESSTTLPPTARTKLAHLQQLATDASVLAENARAVADRLLDAQHAADRRMDHAPDAAARDKLAGELREVTASAVAAREAQRERMTAAAHHRQVAARVRDWLAKPRGGVLVASEPLKLKGETLDEVRAHIASLQIELAATRNAPLPAADVKARIREHVTAMAARGAPRIDAAGAIAWGSSTPHHAPFAVASETLDLLAWLQPERVIERLEADVDRAGDPGNAMSEHERTAKVRDIEAHLLQAERIEEALVERAESAGVSILRRVDADPRALLGIEAKARARAAVAA